VLVFALAACGGAPEPLPPTGRTSVPAATGDAAVSADPCPMSSAPASIAPLPSGTAPSGSWSGGTLAIDVAKCDPKRYFTWLPEGSAWVLVEPSADGCHVWLGGETESPRGGGVAQYCVFPSACGGTLTAEAGGYGGPAHASSAGCTP
jgi:hypothetical protein